MKAQEQSSQNHRSRRGAKPTSIHLVLNWTHTSVFVAVAAIALISLNQGFAGVDRRIDDLNLRMDDRFNGVERRIDRVETRLDGVEVELSDMNTRLSDINARLAVVENVVGVQANAEVESPPIAETSDPDL